MKKLKITNLYCQIFFGFLMASCSEERWVDAIALEDIVAYSEIDGTDKDIIFTVKKGQQCKLGPVVHAKVYENTKIKCQNGDGWIVRKSLFQSIN